jgi:hypothetical protein
MGSARAKSRAGLYPDTRAPGWKIRLQVVAHWLETGEKRAKSVKFVRISARKRSFSRMQFLGCVRDVRGRGVAVVGAGFLGGGFVFGEEWVGEFWLFEVFHVKQNMNKMLWLLGFHF